MHSAYLEFLIFLVIYKSNGPSWNVPLGRRDGRISLASHVNLPSPLDSVAVQRQKFADKGLDDQDLVTLVGNLTSTLYL